MWMGDYPVLPAKSLKTGEDLHKIVDENREQLLGKNCSQKFGGVIPFLPKILSIEKALALQIHPNKELAAKLHKENPEKFTDDNHKPEIAIALGPFEVFAGWKATKDIQNLFDALPPIQKFLPSQGVNIDNEVLRKTVLTMLQSSDQSIKECQQELGKIPKAKYGDQSYILDLLPRLQEQYSIEDPGNLVCLMYVSSHNTISKSQLNGIIQHNELPQPRRRRRNLRPRRRSPRISLRQHSRMHGPL